MKKIRFYFDKDAEQAWLMKMVQEGWAFKRFCLGVYTFQECKPGEYIYQIDLLDSFMKNENEFMDFMKEANVEVVDRWFRWVILRKKAADGSFEMYTDKESKINLYRRIKRMFMGVGIVEFCCFIVEIMTAIRLREAWSMGAAVFIGVILLVFLKAIWKCQWKIEELSRQ